MPVVTLFLARACPVPALAARTRVVGGHVYLATLPRYPPLVEMCEFVGPESQSTQQQQRIAGIEALALVFKRQAT